MNPTPHLANTLSLTLRDPQNATNPPVANSNHVGPHTIHSTSHKSTLDAAKIGLTLVTDSTLDAAKIGLKEAPVHWLDALERKFNADDPSMYPSDITLFKRGIKKREFKQFLLYLISHKEKFIKATSPIFINRGEENLPYSLLYVPDGSHQGAYINLKEHIYEKLGSGAFNKATYCCSIDRDPGKFSVFRCGRSSSIPSSEIKLISFFSKFPEYSDYFVTGPCFNYKGPCAPRSHADAKAAEIEYETSEEESPISEEFCISDPEANRKTKPNPRAKCHSIGHEVLFKTTFNKDEVKSKQGESKQIVDKIGFIFDTLHSLDNFPPLKIGDSPDKIRTSLEIMVRIAVCLHILHNSFNLVHRDIKTSNIFLTKELQPKLGDFGLCKNKGSMIAHGGTLDFCAPELVGAFENRTTATADPSADVWSFGVTLISMLGALDFWQACLSKHESKTEDITKRYQDLIEEFLFFIRLNENDPMVLKIMDVMEKCLVVNPEGRIKTFDALIELNQALKPKCEPLKISPFTFAKKLQQKLSTHNFNNDYLKSIKPVGYSDEELHKILLLCLEKESEWNTAEKPVFIPFEGQYFSGIIYIPEKPTLYLLKAKSATAYEVNIKENEPFINAFFNADKHFLNLFSRKLSDKVMLANQKLIAHPNLFVVGPQITFNKGKNIGFLLDPSHFKLSKAIHISGKLSLEQIVKLMKQLLHVMSMLNDLEIVHCNLNPDCVFLSNNLQPRIADFGLFEKKGTEISDYNAHNKFKAPEMNKPKFIVTPAIDVWGLGMILLNIFGWERNPKFCHEGNFSYPLFLSNRKIVFDELAAQFNNNWCMTQMIKLLKGCLDDEPECRLKLGQLMGKLDTIDTLIQKFRHYKELTNSPEDLSFIENFFEGKTNLWRRERGG